MRDELGGKIMTKIVGLRGRQMTVVNIKNR